jgi:hypothetical protein
MDATNGGRRGRKQLEEEEEGVLYHPQLDL